MVWKANIHEILLAWDAKVDFVRATNPFGPGGGKDQASGKPSIPKDETVGQKRARIKAQMRQRKELEQR